MERVQDVGVAIDDTRSKELVNLDELLAAIAAPTPSAMRDAADRLNARLRTLRAGSTGAEKARTLVAAIEGEALSSAVDAQGVSCRAEAISALLRLGYPWALHIGPEDLAWFRQQRHPTGRRRRALVLAFVVGTFLGLGAAVFVAANTAAGTWSSHRIPRTQAVQPRTAP